jgi:hypothetical protein
MEAINVLAKVRAYVAQPVSDGEEAAHVLSEFRNVLTSDVS